MRGPSLTGQRFGRLIVLGPGARSPSGKPRWSCRCDCGGAALVQRSNLLGRHTVSCGCKHDEVAVDNGRGSARHGLHGTPAYKSWQAMRQRCENPSASGYAKYGGRGITVCDRWKSFDAFIEDMGPRPPGTTLDRFPNGSGNYEPGNCRWATPKQQGRNQRTNHRVTFRGETLSLTEWAERLGLSMEALRQRLGRGWSIEQTVTMRRLGP